MTPESDEPPKRQRGRPRASNAVDTSDILEAAVDAMSHGGYEALSMRGIARSIGVSLPTVQHHFGTKAELYRAMVDYVLSDVDQLRSLVPGRDLEQRIRNGLDASSSRPGFLAAVLADRAAGHQERLAHFAGKYNALIGEPAATVAELQHGRDGRQVNPVAFMVLLLGIGAIAGVPETLQAIYGINLSKTDERNGLAAGLADILGNGLFAPPTNSKED